MSVLAVTHLLATNPARFILSRGPIWHTSNSLKTSNGCFLARLHSKLQGFITLRSVPSGWRRFGRDGGNVTSSRHFIDRSELIKSLIILNSNELITLSFCGFFPRTALARMPKRVETTTISFFLPKPNHDGWTLEPLLSTRWWILRQYHR